LNWDIWSTASTRETCVLVAKRKNKKLTPKEYANLRKRYRNIFTRGEKELPAIPSRQNGKRGRIAKTDAHNLWERLKEYETAVLLFAKLPHVSFTNNRAERDLRMSKVKQKVSGWIGCTALNFDDQKTPCLCGSRKSMSLMECQWSMAFLEFHLECDWSTPFGGSKIVVTKSSAHALRHLR
jgi:hypothetical protein